MKNGRWKRVGNLLVTALCALCFAPAAVKWLLKVRTGETGDDSAVLDALVWLAAAVVWLVRAVRAYRKLPKPERGVAAAAANALLALASWVFPWLRGRLARLVWFTGAVGWTLRAVMTCRKVNANEDTD